MCKKIFLVRLIRNTTIVGEVMGIVYIEQRSKGRNKFISVVAIFFFEKRAMIRLLIFERDIST